MIPFLLVVTQSQLGVLLGLGYLGAGSAVGLGLARRGLPSATAVSALAVWPLLLPLLRDAAPTHGGPLAARIAAVFDALSETLADPAAGEVPWQADLEGLREALDRADARLALVDRVLGDGGDEVEGDLARSLAALCDARRHAAVEIEAVLSGVQQLRLQVGLLALQGDVLPVRDRLRELKARACALEEIAQLRGEGSRAPLLP